METSYCDMLNNIKNSDDCDRNELGELYEKVSRVL